MRRKGEVSMLFPFDACSLKEAVETACAALAVNVLKGNVDQVEALMVVQTLYSCAQPPISR